MVLSNASDNFTYIELPAFELLYGNLTVLETLIFSAELRLQNPPHPSELSALRLLAEMGLNELEDTKTSELSTWQRRILLFATDVIAGIFQRYIIDRNLYLREKYIMLRSANFGS